MENAVPTEDRGLEFLEKKQRKLHQLLAKGDWTLDLD